MMGYLVLGGVGFLFLIVFDLNKIKHYHNGFNYFFMIGISLIGIGSLLVHFNPIILFEVHLWLKIVFYSLAVLSGLFMFYALFGALPFKETYQKTQSNQTITTGVYALCRHPGVWGFFFMYLFIFLASGNQLMLYVTIIWTLLDVIHVWIQDKYFFSKTLIGYDDYKKTTPFLLFNAKSIAHCRQTMKR